MVHLAVLFLLTSSYVLLRAFVLSGLRVGWVEYLADDPFDYGMWRSFFLYRNGVLQLYSAMGMTLASIGAALALIWICDRRTRLVTMLECAACANGLMLIVLVNAIDAIRDQGSDEIGVYGEYVTPSSPRIGYAAAVVGFGAFVAILRTRKSLRTAAAVLVGVSYGLEILLQMSTLH